MKPLHPRSLRWLLAPALALLAGCGYAQNELYPAAYRTVAVPIFENRTFYQGLEFDLSEALVKEIERRTPYKVAPADRADTLLQGTIVAVEPRTLSHTRQGGLPQEQELRVVVNFDWKDVHTGQTLRERRGFAAVGRYIPAHPVGEVYPIAQHEAVQALVRDVVATMRSDW